MKKMVGILRPFDYQQQLFVYEDGNKIDFLYSTVEDFPTTVLGLVDKYDAKQLDLAGPKQFSRGIANKIEEAEMTKYKETTLEINFV